MYTCLYLLLKYEIQRYIVLNVAADTKVRLLKKQFQCSCSCLSFSHCEQAFMILIMIFTLSLLSLLTGFHNVGSVGCDISQYLYCQCLFNSIYYSMINVLLFMYTLVVVVSRQFQHRSTSC